MKMTQQVKVPINIINLLSKDYMIYLDMMNFTGNFDSVIEKYSYAS